MRLNRLWRKTLNFIPRTASIKRVLFLGYRNEEIATLARRRFPKAKITAVVRNKPLHPLEGVTDLRVGDPSSVIRELTEPFDLILFDLRDDDRSFPLFEDTSFLLELQRLLESDGYLFVNSPTNPETAKNFFSLRRMWHKWSEQMVLFRPFGCGGQGDPIPSDFLPYQAVAPLLQRETKVRIGETVVAGDGYTGRRWSVGPLHLEKYCGDTEPPIEEGLGRRVIQWQPITYLDKPKGWHRALMMPNSRKTGYAPVGTADDYWKTWDKHAQRHRKRWLATPDAQIKNVDIETFIAAYRHGTLGPFTKRMFVWMLRRKAEAHGDLVHAWLAIAPSGRAVAGLVVLDIPEMKTSLHVIAFYIKDARHSAVNYGLIDHWFRDAVSKGWKYLDFDIFRGPTDPRSWEGFSRFKAQFGTRFILYPNPLMRFVQ